MNASAASTRHLEKLGDRIEQLKIPDAYEVMTWLQAHIDQSLAESERILETIDAKT